MRSVVAVALALALAGLTGNDADDATRGSAREPLPLPAGSHPAYGPPTIQEPGTWPRPVHPGLPDPLAGLEHLAKVEGTSTGGGIAVFGPYAFIGGRSSGPL